VLLHVRSGAALGESADARRLAEDRGPLRNVAASAARRSSMPSPDSRASQNAMPPTAAALITMVRSTFDAA